MVNNVNVREKINVRKTCQLNVICMTKKAGLALQCEQGQHLNEICILLILGRFPCELQFLDNRRYVQFISSFRCDIFGFIVSTEGLSLVNKFSRGMLEDYYSVHSVRHLV